ncbi:hypothetical protein ES676_10500 [Bizionia saleffrena]|uniref:DUF3108 domain-containing protein n=1 Tax=Bizionia saleffrena TaxID=291189 RepID=A0A8H2LDX4_9FLAO|nr:hypothetical protein [Bizionia saleffrena]TYB72597.1 hypothetical protein ES676_10500 [Bizionia saleffrena]
MKFTISVLFLFFALHTTAQPSTLAGTYRLSIGKDFAHSIDYNLTLNTDSTFVFHSFSNAVKGIPPEVHIYGKGHWKAVKNIISFSTNTDNDISAKYSLDFNTTKGRYITKSLRDKSDREVNTRLQIYESKTRFLHGTELVKQ